jgi:uncharacterized protein YkwD
MRAVTNVRRRAAILVAVVAIGFGASACFAETTPGVGPADPLKAQVVDAMNQDRANNGIGAFTYSPRLDNLAGSWAWAMGNWAGFTHQNLSDVLYSADYAAWHTLGENILVGPAGMSAGQMEQAWMNSAPHRANILNPGFNAVGVGYFRGPDGRLWVCVDFGGI